MFDDGAPLVAILQAKDVCMREDLFLGQPARARQPARFIKAEFAY